MDKWFFYGTLQQPALSMTARAVLPKMERLGEVAVTGRLIVPYGTWPALLPGDNTVWGTLYERGLDFEFDDLLSLDAYEGYRENNPAGSLFIRRITELMDGSEAWVYWFNGNAPPSSIELKHGDYLKWYHQGASMVPTSTSMERG